MRLAIADVLAPAELAAVAAAAGGLAWSDGRRTAGAGAAAVKNNLQADPAGAAHVEITRRVSAALAANATFQAAALPAAISPLMLSRCDPGMGYGAHVDNAIMEGPRLRTDLAFTLFLSEPGDYDGGELVLMEPEGENPVKLPAGSLFLYPATTLHRVEAVGRGRRLACVGWVQSLVRDPRVREMIFDLAQARALLDDGAAAAELRGLLAKTQSNLLRLHAEP